MHWFYNLILFYGGGTVILTLIFYALLLWGHNQLINPKVSLRRKRVLISSFLIFLFLLLLSSIVLIYRIGHRVGEAEGVDIIFQRSLRFLQEHTLAEEKILVDNKYFYLAYEVKRNYTSLAELNGKKLVENIEFAIIEDNSLFRQDMLTTNFTLGAKYIYCHLSENETSVCIPEAVRRDTEEGEVCFARQLSFEYNKKHLYVYRRIPG